MKNDFIINYLFSHIDCAPIYLNEKVIGKVLKEWIDGGRIERKDLFITTKLPDYGNFSFTFTILTENLKVLQSEDGYKNSIIDI